VGSVQNGYNLDTTSYLHVEDKLTGNKRLVKGPQLFIPEPDEAVTANLTATSLKAGEYMKVMDKVTGALRVEKGEALVFLQPHDSVVEDKRKGVAVDSENAVLVRDITTSHLTLVTKPQLFIPQAQQTIVEVRKVIRLEEYETCVVKDSRQTTLSFMHGPTCFFVQPYCELITQRWSTGLHKDKRGLTIGAPPNLFDCRPHFMWYEFDCRTRDNVELVLGVTFFWAVVEVAQMISMTDDASGDLCSHARSSIISAVSQLPLEDFLSSFNAVVKLAVMDPNQPDHFYSSRGMSISEVEVRSVACKDPSTQKILQEIITGHTHRMNQLQKQEGQNEVQLKQFEGEIEAEKMKGKLLDIKRAHAEQEGEQQGLAEAARVKAFLQGTSEVLEAVEQRVSVFNTLRKQEMLKDLSQGNASMVFTPADVDLKIDTKAAAPRNN